MDFWRHAHETELGLVIRRGWVFQELLLSPRNLYFGDRILIWSCAHGYASEINPAGLAGTTRSRLTVTPESQSIFQLPNTPFAKLQHVVMSFLEIERSDFQLLQGNILESSDLQSSFTFNRLWFSVVQAYSKGKLTRSEDKLIALSGVAERIRQSSGLTYVAGLWRQNMPLDLLWRTRIRAGEGELSPRSPTYRAPTWSWGSLDTEIEGWCFFLYPLLNREEKISCIAEIVSAELLTHPDDKA
jgi:hypothetical protein